MTASPQSSTAAPVGVRTLVRAILGKSALGGFFGLSDGDCFETLDGKRWLLKPYNGGWALRAMKDDGRADFSAPIHPDFQGVDYHGFIHTANLMEMNGISYLSRA